MPSSLPELMAAENGNFESTGARRRAELLHDIEAIYEGLTPLFSFPTNDPESDEVRTAVSIFYEMAFCRRQVTIATLTLMPGYRGDAMLSLRRAIEASAFAVRISKHNELAKIWLEAGQNDNAYRVYSKAFRPVDLFPDMKHPDYDPALRELKITYDLCSQITHGSILGLASHFDRRTAGPKRLETKSIMNFFDIPSERDFNSALFHNFGTHLRIIQAFGRILRPHASPEIAAWDVQLMSVQAKAGFHFQQTWVPSS